MKSFYLIPKDLPYLTKWLIKMILRKTSGPFDLRPGVPEVHGLILWLPDLVCLAHWAPWLLWSPFWFSLFYFETRSWSAVQWGKFGGPFLSFDALWGIDWCETPVPALKSDNGCKSDGLVSWWVRWPSWIDFHDLLQINRKIINWLFTVCFSIFCYRLFSMRWMHNWVN